MLHNLDLQEVLPRLRRSKFRMRFKLDSTDLAYIERIGMESIAQHAADFVEARLAPAEPKNDGKQTPFKGHPVFKAQHATATCCRGCLAKWYSIPKGRALTDDERRKIVVILSEWIKRSMAGALSLLFMMSFSIADAKEAEMIELYNAARGNVERAEKVEKTDAEWKKLLTPEEYAVTRKKGTERAFSGKCELPGKEGIYKCVCCGTDLFAVGRKFESGTGWPSFWEPVSNLNVRLEPDKSGGMTRTEVACARCGAHLGHVFDDGPPPTGLRYCINSVALKFSAAKPVLPARVAFAAGCFWGVEEAFRRLPGVISTRVGYAGGRGRNPSYKDVCTGRTGHAETVEIEYDPSKISYNELLKAFWDIHDPTTPNRQGPDVGTQYRSAIFYYNDEQKKEALGSAEELGSSGRYMGPIVTEIVPAGVFWPAEEYHQKYILKGGRAACEPR